METILCKNQLMALHLMLLTKIKIKTIILWIKTLITTIIIKRLILIITTTIKVSLVKIICNNKIHGEQIINELIKTITWIIILPIITINLGWI